MNWKEAVIYSKRNTARRTEFNGNDKVSTSIVCYDDGSGYILIAKNGKVDYDLSHEAKEEDIKDLEKFTDWEPYI